MFNFRNNSAPTNYAKTGTYAPTGVAKTVVPTTLQFYMTLCNEKGEMPTCNTQSLQSEVQAEIERVKKLPNFRPMSEAQRNKITNRCQEIGMSTPNFEGMSLSKASDLIVILDARYVALGLDKIITPKQADMIENMSMCPDIPTFTLFLPKETLDKCDEMQFQYNNMLHQLNVGKITEAELSAYEADMTIFQSECMAVSGEGDIRKVDRETASEFIQAYQSIYYSWFNSRASEGKRKLLGELYKRQGTVMTEKELFQFDNHTADVMINQLQKEQGVNYGGTLEGMARELKPMPKCPIDVQKYEHDKLQALIHSLYAILGQQAEEDSLQNPSLDMLGDLCKVLQLGFVSEADLIEMLGEVFTEVEITKIMTNEMA